MAWRIGADPRAQRLRRRVVAGITAAVACTRLLALDPFEPPSSYISAHWDTEDGLPHNTVLDICQTGDGYLWVGTARGIARFDGLHFTVFNEHNTPGIANSEVTCFAETADGSLWIGTDDGLTRYQGGQFHTYTSRDGIKTLNNTVNALCVDHEGTLWIGTREGITRWSRGKFRQDINTAGYDLQGLRSMMVDRNDTVWISAGDDVFRYAGGKFTRFGKRDGLPGVIVATVASDAFGRIWAVTHAGLYGFDGQRFVPFEHNEALTSRADGDALADHAGNFWIGSAVGLDRYVDGRVTCYHSAAGGGIGAIYAIFEDREDGLWLGTANGLYRLTNRRGYTYASSESLTGTVGLAVLQAHDNAVWLASYANGVDRIAPDGAMMHLRAGNPLSSQTVKCIYEAPDHTMWFGMRDSAVDHWVNGRVRTFVYPAGVPTSRPVTALFATKDDLLVGIAKRGLLHLQGGAIVPVQGTAALAADTVWAFDRLREGTLLAGTSKGLYQRFANGRWGPLNLPGVPSAVAIRAISQSPDGTVWLATDGLGLVRWQNGQARAYGTHEGMVDDTLFSAVDDRIGNIWVSSLHGIGRISQSQFAALDRGAIPALNCVTFGRSDGLLSGSTAGDGAPAAALLNNGRLITGTDRGFAVIDPTTLHANSRPPAVVIEGLTADDHPLPLAEKVFVPAGTNRIEITYTALSLIAPERQRFRYELEGLDTSWVNADRHRSATFTHLAPGGYTFRVIACNSDGVWNMRGAAITLRILPRYYQTLIFQLGAIALFIVALAGGIRSIMRRRYQRRLAHLEQQHALERERTRIARDLHDELGAGLTEVGMLADELVETSPKDLNTQLSGLAWRIRRLGTELSGIVWTMNAKQSSIEHLAQFIRRYAERLFRNTRTRCVVTGVETMPDVAISPSARHHLLAAVKEALNNIIVHAGATEAQIAFAYFDAALEIRIRDNGSGFDLREDSAATFEGNGLRNLRARVEELGGTIKLVSSPGAGTLVVLRVGCGSAAAKAEPTLRP